MLRLMQHMKSTAKFTDEQLAKLVAAYETTPERLGDASIEKLRNVVRGFSDAALAQVIVVKKIKWISTLATTEARVRKLDREALSKILAKAV